MSPSYEVPLLMDQNGQMTRFRDGTWYSTASSRLLRSFIRGAVTDPDFVDERLFQNEAGLYFLVGRGGPESIWGVLLAGDVRVRAGAKNLRPMTAVGARGWIAERFGS